MNKDSATFPNSTGAMFAKEKTKMLNPRQPDPSDLFLGAIIALVLFAGIGIVFAFYVGWLLTEVFITLLRAL